MHTYMRASISVFVSEKMICVRSRFFSLPKKLFSLSSPLFVSPVQEYAKLHAHPLALYLTLNMVCPKEDHTHMKIKKLEIQMSV